MAGLGSMQKRCKMIDVDVLNNQDWEEFFETFRESGKKYGSIIVVFEGKSYEVGIREVGWESE